MARIIIAHVAISAAKLTQYRRNIGHNNQDASIIHRTMVRIKLFWL